MKLISRITKPFKKDKSSSKSNQNNNKNGEQEESTNGPLEFVYKLQYRVVDKSSGASTEHKFEDRTLKINEEGVYLGDKMGKLTFIDFILIKEFSLDQNWMDWAIIMRDGNSHHFRSYEFQTKVKEIIVYIIDMDIASYEDRAVKAENMIEILSKKIAALEASSSSSSSNSLGVSAEEFKKVQDQNKELQKQLASNTYRINHLVRRLNETQQKQ
ncbi:hypothetical protein DFA_05765 [Cavenderia fasciculata]|uniref:Uncharacterized protein n=1 Tax=Cavenderia fasciculata TaxID=261658 RepID=F4PMI4_CACFS|nr:uncharacterized protein DFA_05765 [Cavenderia fasciculata]EGG23631.1 hypothetical protein DFA_05765 [Cavenderia fasciculata]|eukprot:XP_004361482.1 hypothetical protein DFA_05765 [Cavenderia fasciculata]